MFVFRFSGKDRAKPFNYEPSVGIFTPNWNVHQNNYIFIYIYYEFNRYYDIITQYMKIYILFFFCTVCVSCLNLIIINSCIYMLFTYIKFTLSLTKSKALNRARNSDFSKQPKALSNNWPKFFLYFNERRCWIIYLVTNVNIYTITIIPYSSRLRITSCQERWAVSFTMKE